MVTVGQLAPDFNLPLVQGGQFSLLSYRHHKAIILWFSRGITCMFCRGYMQNFIDEYANLAVHEIEVVQVAPNLLGSARQFFRVLPPYPFVCDPDKRLNALYGLGDEGVLEATRNSVVSFTQAALHGQGMETFRASWLDLMNRNFLRRLHHHALTAVDQGIFLIDKQGMVRYRLAVGAIDPLPAAAELLALCQTVCL